MSLVQNFAIFTIFTRVERTLFCALLINNFVLLQLTLVRQREKLEPVLKHFLVEDRGIDGSPSYVDFLCHMHKEIRTILS